MRIVVCSILVAVSALVVAAANNVQMAYMMPTTYAYVTTKEACDAKNKPWVNSQCWSSHTVKKMAIPALKAARDFNARDGSYVPQFADAATKACDKQIQLTLVDSGRQGVHALKNIIALQGTAKSPDVVVGPANSGICRPTASFTAVYDIPQISYLCTSSSLDDTTAYPRFMRSIPLDDAVAFSACKFWQSLGYKRAAVIWENNAYGETYKEGLVRSCLTMGIQVESISVQTEVEGQPSSLPAQVTQMKQSNLKIFFVVVVDDNTLAALLKLAFESELLGSGTLWTYADDGPVGSGFESLSVFNTTTKSAIGGSVQIKVAGVNPTNTRYKQFALDVVKEPPQPYSDFVGAPFNSEYALMNETILGYDIVNEASWLSGTSAYIYDAVAAVALLACSVSPTGPLPADFGTLLYKKRKDLKFDGLSGSLTFDDKGNRDPSSASFILNNIEYELDTDGKPTVSKPVAKAYFNSKTQLWETQPGAKIMFNGGSTTAPSDGMCEGDGTCGSLMTKHVYSATSGSIGDGGRDGTTTPFQVVATPRGKCQSGSCACDPAWSGTVCDIATSTTNGDQSHDKSFVAASVKGLCLALCAINITLAVVFAMWAVMFRAQSAVRAAQPQFLVLICLGCIISSATIIPVTMDDDDGSGGISKAIGVFVPDNASPKLGIYPEIVYGSANVSSSPSEVLPTLDTACMGSIWLYSIGFIVTFSSLFAKVWRINKIFNNKRFRAVKVTAADVMWPIMLMVAIDGAILGAWQTTSPLTWKRLVTASNAFRMPQESIGICGVRSPSVSGTFLDPSKVDSAERQSPPTDASEPVGAWAFLTPIILLHAIVLIVGNVLAYKSRRISTRFSESKYIAICMVSNLQILIISIPVLIIVADNPVATVFVRSGVVFLNDLTVLLFIFVPKFGAVHLGWSQEDMTGSTASGTTHTGGNKGGPAVRFGSSSGRVKTGQTAVTETGQTAITEEGPKHAFVVGAAENQDLQQETEAAIRDNEVSLGAMQGIIYALTQAVQAVAAVDNGPKKASSVVPVSSTDGHWNNRNLAK